MFYRCNQLFKVMNNLHLKMKLAFFAVIMSLLSPGVLSGSALEVLSVDPGSPYAALSVLGVLYNGLDELCSLFSSVSGASSNEPCVERCCPKPIYTVPIKLCQGFVEASPLSVSFLPRNNRTEQIDNICYVFIRSEGSDFIVIMSVVYKNGTFEQFSYIIGDAQCPGVFIGAGPTCTYQDSLVSVQCNGSFIVNRCFNFGICQEFDAPYEPGREVYLGLSCLQRQSDACKDEQIAFVKMLQGCNDPDYVKLPQLLSSRCALCLPEGGTAFNAVNLDDKDKTCAVSNCATAADHRNSTDIGLMFQELTKLEQNNCKKRWNAQ